ncbi:MAG: peptide chain release factor-like protein [Thermodesulfovibrionales bacterium]|nr:peptide chain release factor-like protein [Thermodesulfovibrionales bacterium]
MYEKMLALNIKEEDIEETFIKSGGRGGQKVNKTSSCVYLKHIPTGIEIKCQKDRSQSLNRYYARVILLQKIEQLVKGKESEFSKAIDRIRKQKRKRAFRAKKKYSLLKSSFYKEKTELDEQTT